MVLLLWTGLHAYVLSRLLSIPFIAHHVPPTLLIAVVLFLGASYILARLAEHFQIGGATHVLEYIGANWAGIFFLLFVTTLMVDIVTGFGLMFRPMLPALRSGALITAGVLVLISMVQAWRDPEVTEYEVCMKGLTRRTVLAVASDMHLGPMLGRRWARERAAQFQLLQPDIILLVGDIFEGDETTHEKWLPVLRQFHAPDGVFMVTGNHELYAGAGKIIELLRRAGIRVLRDESVEPLAGLVISGVDDVAFRGRKAHAAALAKVLRERPAGPTILLSHTPLLAEDAERAGVKLMLSGHTHEGQIWPFNYLVRMAFRLLSGSYNLGGMIAIVCRGTGTWGPRMRLWKRSELLRITLLPE
jgi:hypothetical protein